METKGFLFDFEIIISIISILSVSFGYLCYGSTTIINIHPLQVIFIHYKSRIATVIRGLYWMKMTIVNSGLKG